MTQPFDSPKPTAIHAHWPAAAHAQNNHRSEGEGGAVARTHARTWKHALSKVIKGGLVDVIRDFKMMIRNNSILRIEFSSRSRLGLNNR